jgi:hypothetical protein
MKGSCRKRDRRDRREEEEEGEEGKEGDGETRRGEALRKHLQELHSHLPIVICERQSALVRQMIFVQVRGTNLTSSEKVTERPLPHPDPFNVRGGEVIGIVTHPFGTRAVDREDLEPIGIAIDQRKDRDLQLVSNLER